jgi:hypothetical protein
LLWYLCVSLKGVFEWMDGKFVTIALTLILSEPPYRQVFRMLCCAKMLVVLFEVLLSTD